jgi:hypothetical protein
MALSNSPSLDQYKKGAPQAPKENTRKKYLLRALITLLLLVLVVDAIIVMNSRDVALLTGRGDVKGQVVDGKGNGLQVTVFVFGVDKPVETDAEGNFIYENVPAGARLLIVTHNGYAAEYPIQVAAGQMTDIGQISFDVVTPVPEE